MAEAKGQAQAVGTSVGGLLVAAFSPMGRPRSAPISPRTSRSTRRPARRGRSGRRSWCPARRSSSSRSRSSASGSPTTRAGPLTVVYRHATGELRGATQVGRGWRLFATALPRRASSWSSPPRPGVEQDVRNTAEPELTIPVPGRTGPARPPSAADRDRERDRLDVLPRWISSGSPRRRAGSDRRLRGGSETAAGWLKIARPGLTC